MHITDALEQLDGRLPATGLSGALPRFRMMESGCGRTTDPATIVQAIRLAILRRRGMLARS